MHAFNMKNKFELIFLNFMKICNILIALRMTETSFPIASLTSV